MPTTSSRGISRVCTRLRRSWSKRVEKLEPRAVSYIGLVDKGAVRAG
jgi:hypothetical protein